MNFIGQEKYKMGSNTDEEDNIPKNEDFDTLNLFQLNNDQRFWLQLIGIGLTVIGLGINITYLLNDLYNMK